MSTINTLTHQESIVLALVAQGKRNAEIAQELYLSVRTVESHVHRIFQKLKLSSRTEAAIYALQSGFLAKPKFPAIPDGSEERSNPIRSSGE